NTFVDKEGAKFDMDRDLFAARMVGRWKSGAPLAITPLQDDPLLGEDKRHNNDFDFANDPHGRRCPFAAHIRKAYPRNDITPGDTDIHRIIRRGISFGPEVSAEEKKTAKTHHERGMMFVCYQTSIDKQFEYITRHRFNDPEFAPAGNEPGLDPLVGQDRDH